jgi:hypothetical protein
VIGDYISGLRRLLEPHEDEMGEAGRDFGLCTTWQVFRVLF